MTQDTKTIAHTIKVGNDFKGKVVAKIGEAGGRDGSALVPVQFEDGTYGVVWDNKDWCDSLVSSVPEWSELLANSEDMPVPNPGIGSDVLHIVVKQGGKPVLLKHYYNEKATYRNDSIHRD